VIRTRHAALLLLGAVACATPGQVRRVETQVAVMQRSQERADSARAAELARIIAMQTRAMDSLMAITRTLDRVDRTGREQSTELLEARKQILAVQQRIDQSQQGLRELRAQLDARTEMAAMPADSMPTTQPAAGQPPVTAGQPTAATLYANGAQSLRINAFGTARNAFREVLRLYPTSSYAADAAFGIGDAFLREQRTDSAQVAFARVTRDYPASMRAASALYKLGIMAQERGNLADARRYFQQVVVPKYQAAEEYELAQDRLRGLPQ